MSIYATDENNNLYKISGGSGTKVTLNGQGQKEWSADFVENEKDISGENNSNPIIHNNDAPVVFAEAERQKSKNLCGLKNLSQTLDVGLTCVFNEQTQTITLNGSPTGTADCMREIKNLFSSIKNMENKQVTISLIYVSGQWTSGNARYYVGSLDDGSAYNDRFGGDLMSRETDTIGTYTIPTNNTYDDLHFYMGAGCVFDNYVLKVQIEEGTVATDWQPYNGEIVHEKDIQLNIITAKLSASFEPPDYANFHIVPLVQDTKVGNKLSINSDGGIVIGAGVSKILISASTNIYVSEIGYSFLRIVKNSVGLLEKYIQTKDNGYQAKTLDITPCLFIVSEGDIITLQYKTSALSSLLYAGRNTYMTVEVVE